jgi:hypothetical protein
MQRQKRCKALQQNYVYRQIQHYRLPLVVDRLSGFNVRQGSGPDTIGEQHHRVRDVVLARGPQ